MSIPKHSMQGGRNYLGGELNSPVTEWLNKGLMSMSSPRMNPSAFHPQPGGVPMAREERFLPHPPSGAGGAGLHTTR
eukprot:5098503-Pyramimonas_sp.AAC.2